MARTVIRNASVVLLNRVADNYSTAIEGGRIAQVAPDVEVDARSADAVIDADGGALVPGLIDLHIHGAHRYLVDNGPGDLAALCELLPRYGVTGFMPTVCSYGADDAERLALLAGVESAGASILGFHLEGAFLAKPGALSEIATSRAEPEFAQALIDAAKPYAVVFSISPELDGVLDVLPLMTAGAFITHTSASVEQTQAAIDAGARHATHFYDVFPAPDETDPGVRTCGAVEAILADPRVSVDFILDGVHVHPVAVRMALACKGPHGVCLITDANVGAGLSAGRYTGLADAEVEFASEGAPARLTEQSPMPGALAGSGLTMDRALRNAVKMLGVELPLAVRMTSANPARVLGLDEKKGRVAKGYDADLVLLDRDLTVRRTWVGGECGYARDGEEVNV